MVSFQADSQIVAGEGRRCARIRILIRAESEDAEGAADLGLAEGSGFGFAEGAEFAGAALDDGWGDFVRKSGGFGAGALGKGEDVEIGEGQTLDEGERGGMFGFRFAGEAGDDVGADGGVGKAFADELDAAGVVLGAVPAVHGGEDAVGAGLQRHVEMLGDAIGPGEEFDEVLGDVERLDGADAETFDGGFIEDASEEILEFDARGKVAAVGAEVDAAEDDFAGGRWYERRLGVDRQECLSHREALDFVDYDAGREATAFSANEGDDAIGAAGIAAVLNLQGGAGVVPFPAEDGGAEQNILFKNIAAQDFGGRAQEGHGVRFQSGGWKKGI